MSSNSEKTNLEDIIKKIQEGNSSMLIIAGFLLIIPVVCLLVMTSGPKGGKKISQEKIKSMVQRKNVFNFGTKSESGKQSAPRSSSAPKSSHSWFTEKTPEQKIADELETAEKVLEKKASEIQVPIELVGDARKQFIAERNYNLSMGNGALEAGRYREAEEYIMKAIDDAKDNEILMAYALGSLCALYEKTGDKKKLQEAYKLYFEAVSKMPPEYGGMDLKRNVRDAYQSLLVLGKHISDSDLAQGMDKEPLVKSGKVPSNVNVREVYKSFPFKYE